MINVALLAAVLVVAVSSSPAPAAPTTQRETSRVVCLLTTTDDRLQSMLDVLPYVDGVIVWAYKDDDNTSFNVIKGVAEAHGLNPIHRSSATCQGCAVPTRHIIMLPEALLLGCTSAIAQTLLSGDFSLFNVAAGSAAESVGYISLYTLRSLREVKAK